MKRFLYSIKDALLCLTAVSTSLAALLCMDGRTENFSGLGSQRSAWPLYALWGVSVTFCLFLFSRPLLPGRTGQRLLHCSLAFYLLSLLIPYTHTSLPAADDLHIWSGIIATCCFLAAWLDCWFLVPGWYRRCASGVLLIACASLLLFSFSGCVNGTGEALFSVLESLWLFASMKKSPENQ